MKKLRFVIDWSSFELEDLKAMKKCGETRKFSAARVVDSTELEYFSEIDKIGEIKDLKIDGWTSYDNFETDEFIKIAHLLTKVEICKIATNVMNYEPNEMDEWISDFFRSECPTIQCDFLTDLQLDKCDINFISQVLVGSKNLKRFSITQPKNFQS